MIPFYLATDDVCAPRKLIIIDRDTHFERAMSLQEAREFAERIETAVNRAERQNT